MTRGRSRKGEEGLWELEYPSPPLFGPEI